MTLNPFQFLTDLTAMPSGPYLGWLFLLLLIFGLMAVSKIL